jgi:hypothetical protein
MNIAHTVSFQILMFQQLLQAALLPRTQPFLTSYKGKIFYFIILLTSKMGGLLSFPIVNTSIVSLKQNVFDFSYTWPLRRTGETLGTWSNKMSVWNRIHHLTYMLTSSHVRHRNPNYFGVWHWGDCRSRSAWAKKKDPISTEKNWMWYTYHPSYMEKHEIGLCSKLAWQEAKNPISKIIRAKTDDDVALVAELPA